MTYVRNAWYVAAWASEVSERPVGLRILNEPIVLWRDDAGRAQALADRCVHRLAPLSLGRCERGHLRCMYHGLLYDRTGHVVEIPGQDKVPPNLVVRSYPAVERHHWIWVWMGDAAAADETLIPRLLDLDHSGFVFGRGRIDYAAAARLVSDNLLDLSHTSFLHFDTFAVSEVWARQRPIVTEHARGIRSQRWIRGEGPMGQTRSAERLDTYFEYDVFVPGIVMMRFWTYPAGTADALDGQRPDAGAAPLQEFTSQAVTPLTDKTARYFYMTGAPPRAGEKSYDMSVAERAFAEDKLMIEAQQGNIDNAPDQRFVATPSDRGVVLFNRLVERLAAEEASEARPVVNR